jgi:hypothetical protein
MFCAKCGAQNDDNAFRCTRCGEVLMRGAAGDGSGLGPAKAPLAAAIIVTLFCCVPSGIVSIVYASMAMGKNNEGRYEEAHDLARKANIWAWVSFGLGLAVMAIYFVGAVVGGVAGKP